MLILRTNLLLFVISFVTQLFVTHAATNRQTPERIFGGQPATDHQFAYQVSLRYAGDNVHFCSGSILSQRWIVSAGHCVFYADAESVVAVVGSQQRNSSIASDVDGRPGAYAIERLVVHAAYGHLSMRNDIALLRTAREMIMSGQVAPVGLDSDGHFLGAGWVVWASGWMSDLVSIDLILSTGLGYVPSPCCYSAFRRPTASRVRDRLAENTRGKDEIRNSSNLVEDRNEIC